MEKDISAQYLNGFLLNEVGVSPKTQDHFIHIHCVCERERERDLTTRLFTHNTAIELYVFDPVLETEWRNLLNQYCQLKNSIVC